MGTQIHDDVFKDKLVAMLVMHVRYVGMGVPEFTMMMKVHVRLA